MRKRTGPRPQPAGEAILAMVRRSPEFALGACFVAGLVLGWMLLHGRNRHERPQSKS